MDDTDKVEMEKTETGGVEGKVGSDFWKYSLKKHWKVYALFIVGCIVAFIGCILVLMWFMGYQAIGGNGTWNIGLWSIKSFIGFMLRLIVWEILFIGIPVIAVVAVAWALWFKKLPTEEQERHKFWFRAGEHKDKVGRNQNRRTGGGFGVLNVFVFIAFLIILAIDGTFNTPIGSLPYSYFVYAWLWGLLWVGIIAGIPLTIGAIWWLHRELKEIP
jgi:hypothetical protein